LFARAAVAALEQSTLDGRHAARSSVCKIGRRRAVVSVAVFSRFAIYANVVGPTTKPTIDRATEGMLHVQEPYRLS